jgi:hypothetical protein
MVPNLVPFWSIATDWKPEYGGRFIPWPCSDVEAGNKARAAELQSTLLAFDELPEESKAQIPTYARYETHALDWYEV